MCKINQERWNLIGIYAKFTYNLFLALNQMQINLQNSVKINKI